MLKVMVVVRDEPEDMSGSCKRLPVARISDEEAAKLGKSGIIQMAKDFTARNGHTFVEAMAV